MKKWCGLQIYCEYIYNVMTNKFPMCLICSFTMFSSCSSQWHRRTYFEYNPYYFLEFIKDTFSSTSDVGISLVNDSKHPDSWHQNLDLQITMSTQHHLTTIQQKQSLSTRALSRNTQGMIRTDRSISGTEGHDDRGTVYRRRECGKFIAHDVVFSNKSRTPTCQPYYIHRQQRHVWNGETCIYKRRREEKEWVPWHKREADAGEVRTVEQ